MLLVASLTPFLLFSAFLLLLLVTLSAPIIHSIYLFSITSNVQLDLIGTDEHGTVHFGVFGYCVTPIQSAVVWFQSTTPGYCSPHKLGYHFDEGITRALNIDQYSDLISGAITMSLVMHPIACGLIFLALVHSALMWHTLRNPTRVTRRGRLVRFLPIASFVATLGATLLTTVVFAIDIYFVASTRHRTHSDTYGILTENWGNAVWMVVGATIALWIATLGSCAGIFTARRQRKAVAY
ncbi:hypothetical protein PUNSTDRAFT_136138 [Punctularia strigosozonata HHB-11173 SS5]|uniref:uncharacterized protein n=1 Tax=Punctularia strigosozonata (strain HHB-11173) TaxID=741275 RepID=UPI00044180AE|nr:uncharacterized protein PUNSTDRAFT_136138 [Punctularia strigosozonata HHB-11173 SS5]EIN07458.1 hypothetical protein PUNSTDRAFT_136138 [Punctularia strigosozonata HHB-11173 SS5]